MDIFQPYIERTKKVFQTLLPEEIEKKNEEAYRHTEKSFYAFKEGFQQGLCYLCGGPLKSFSAEKPCIHWLLRPKRFKKKHFKELFNIYGYFQMEAYVRWVANQMAPFKNINDLQIEKDDKKIFETTIKYKHLEWSFSCSPSDLEGHKNSAIGNFPHFHFQMRMEKRPFIDYSDFHVPFKDEDIWRLAMLHQDEIPFEHHFDYGEGMQSILGEESLENVVNNSVTVDDEEEAAFRLQIFVEAKPGETISGADIVALMQESKRTGEPLAKLVRRLDASVRTVVMPGDGVPEIAERTKTKRNR
ncbi:MAG: hypothetical protein M1461_12995 [Nitrospirae bacterium]|nr:hypothetical protein [Nitrospirota bacterium]